MFSDCWIELSDVKFAEMKNWIRAVCVSCLVELPIIFIWMSASARNPEGFVPQLLSMYHGFSVGFTFGLLNAIWNHQSMPHTPNSLLFVLLYLFQAAIATPVVYLLFWTFDRIRRRTQ